MYQLLMAELWHRKLNITLSLLALVAAATLFVGSPTLLDGYRKESKQHLVAMQAATESALEQMQAETETGLKKMQAETDDELEKMQIEAENDLAKLDKQTKKIMRDLGFNLRIVHKNTDMTQLFAAFVAFDMPEEYVSRLANSPEITKIVHLVATLKQMVQWEDKSRLLVGFAPEATQMHIEQKAPMGLQIKAGTVYLGAISGEGHAVGDTVEILGKEFEIARILPAHGTAEEDIAICMHLKDAQEILDKPGRISEILALGCKCKTIERIEEITQQLELVLPEAKVMEHRMQAIARDDQRKLIVNYNAHTIALYRANRERIFEKEKKSRQQIVDREKKSQQQIVAQEIKHRTSVMQLLTDVTSVVTPLIILVCAIWVGMLAWSNVRERRTEIGLLRALGKSSTSIAGLFLGKAVLLGVVGGAFGCTLGFVMARWIATSMLDVDVANFTPSLMASCCALLGTPVVAAMASYLPTLSAVNQDPAVVLMDG
jgi:hypothetical protein